MHGDINRAGFALDHAIHLLLGQVGQRYEIASHQRQTPVVIANIQAWTHPRRHLLNKTENAVVGACLRAAHQRGFERHPQRIFCVLVDMHGTLHAVFIFEKKIKRRSGGQILIIHKVKHRRPVDGNERFSGRDAMPGGKGSGKNADNALGHGSNAPLFQINPIYYLQITG